jgi:Ca-activated chloride channel family protein
MNELPVMGTFHFLRPLWLLGLLALPPLLWWLRRHRQRGEIWRGVIDAHLLPHLLESEGGAGNGWRAGLSQVAFVVAGLLAVLALAGPSWRELPQPLFQDRMPLVIAVDMSSAANAADVPPSRLLQARAKIAQILHERGGGQTALVAFAEDGFTVSPLTDDANNVALFLDALSPEVMPRDGSRADRGIEEAMRLLKRAGFHKGDILLITDRAGGSADSAALDARSAGYRVSVLGLGGLAGGKYRNANGEVHTARLHGAELRALAVAGGGRYAAFAPGDADLRSLGVLQADRIDQSTAQDKRAAAALDEGFWLLPPLLLLGLLAFRRGVLAVLVIALWLPWRPAAAADLWERKDQRQHEAMAQGVDAYHRGDFKAAASAWSGLPGAEAAYNRGNALARLQRYDEAIAEYDRALRQQPGMTDAIENRRKVEQARRRQQQKEQEQQQRQQKNQQQKDQQKDQQQKDGQQNPSQGQQQKEQEEKARQQREQQQKQQQQKEQEEKERQRREQQEKERQQKQQQGRPMPGEAPKPVDPVQAAEQAAADRAERERMARAHGSGPTPQSGTPPKETREVRERRLANEAWLRRVPDDPGALLREKFRLEQKRRKREGDR